MCAYCMTGDWVFKHDTPWTPNPWPNTVPVPVNPGPVKDWDLTKLKEYLEILKEIKALEDQLTCPCEPNKADYIKMFKDKISELEQSE